MRERSTWNRDEVKTKVAALPKRADPYTMNQDHPQPAADKYVTGDPSTFAEDVHTPNTWEVEYKGDEVKRDEIGLPDFRPDTFNHSEKTAREVLLKKADLCVAVARLMLAGTKQASDLPTIENQAYALMYLPDQQLIDTHKRLAGEQQQDDGDDDEGQQDKQAQDQQTQDQQTQTQDDKGQDKQAQGQEQQDQGQQDKQAPAPAADKQAKDEGGDQNANWPVKSAAELQQIAQRVIASVQTGNYSAAQQQIQELVQQAQGQSPQQVQAQIQQMIQEAMGKMTQQIPVQQQAPMQQAPMQQQSDGDEQVLDQMLAQDNCGPMAEVDIQMDPAPMDVMAGELGPEDEALRTLFAQDDDEKSEQDQAKQASNIRTASTRTVGTRPTAGVAKLGGAGASGGNTVPDLSSLWQTAPDVRDVFGV